MIRVKILKSVDLEQHEDRVKISDEVNNSDEMTNLIDAVMLDVAEQNPMTKLDVMVIINKRGEV